MATGVPWIRRPRDALAGSEYADLARDAFRRRREIAANLESALSETVDVERLFRELAVGGIGEQMGYLRRATNEDIRRPGDGY